MNWTKYDYEQYALLIVADFLKIPANHFKLNEKPDIHNMMDSIGIEVIRELGRQETYAGALIKKYVWQRKRPRGKKVLRALRERQFESAVRVIGDDTVVISPLRRYVRSEERLKKIERSILKKEIGFQVKEKRAGDAKFKLNYVFVVFPFSTVKDEEIVLCLDKIFRAISFDGIFLCRRDTVFFKTYSGTISYNIREKQQYYIGQVEKAAKISA